MRNVLVLTAALLTVCVASTSAMNQKLMSYSNDSEFLTQPDGHVGDIADTTWFGGSGTGNGTIVIGGTWNWEAASGEPAQFFVDGDPVGNQYRDGWIFDDRTARRGPSQNTGGHWSTAGVYNFNDDTGGMAHRATTHANDGEDDGPNPLIGGWSMWIASNLRLNPEHCGWTQTRGYGSGWSQGFQKAFPVAAGNLGAVYDISFTHRYATEAGWDSCWVEISFDGIFWDQVGNASNANGMYSGGSFPDPQPSPAGGADVANLITWPSNNAGTLYVRFRLASDALVADDNVGGNYMWAWQVDNIQLLKNNVPDGALSTFESGWDGWQPKAYEGFDFDITTDPNRPAGRLERVANLSAPLVCECPETNGLENRIMLFADKDDLDMNDAFQSSHMRSPAFAIGGPSLPDLDGDAGRLFKVDWYLDGGSGLFETGPQFAWFYWPFNAFNCPYTPSSGEPGFGTVFNWTTEQEEHAQLFSQGTNTTCAKDVFFDCSAFLPADADSVIVMLGALSQCRSDATCDINDNGAPFFDNVRFGVYDPAGLAMLSNTLDRFADNFPTTNTGFPLTATNRTDASYSLAMQLGVENPLRWVRADTAATAIAAPNTAVFLRWAVERGACQPNLTHPFFVAFPPTASGTYPNNLTWHAARMDTAQSLTNGSTQDGVWMTCFHELDPRNGTFWTGAPPAVEPCDDILPDGLFTAGTNVYYFFEARTASGGGAGNVLATFPFGKNRSFVRTSANWKDYWLQINNLPELTPACDGTYANSMLIVNDYATGGVPGRATIQKARLNATLGALGLEFDTYDAVSTNYTTSYDTIGRREDRPTQQPRPPSNGATDQMLNGYDCIWYTGGLLDSGVMLSDRRTLSLFGGQSSIDQQKLETWIGGCTAGNNRLLVLEGSSWASFIDVNTTNGPQFLSNRGVDVLSNDYAQNLAANDLRRCARITTSRPADRFDDAEILGTGCSDDINVDVYATVSGGEAVTHFVESLEDGDDPVNCADDIDRPAWLNVVRRRNTTATCQHSASMAFAFAELYPLNCTDQCLFDDYKINGENAELVIDLFTWAGCPINTTVIGVDPAEAPRFVNELYQAQPNPANPSATIRYTIAQKGHVSLKIFDVSGRLVRSLVDEVQEPATSPFEAVWNGLNDGGQHVGSGVFFYQIDAPGFTSSKKLVILK